MKGMAIAGLVLSIVGVVFGVAGFTAITSILGLPIAIVGLILSCVGGKKLREAGQGTGLATAGLVLGIIAVVFTTITFFTCGLCHICAGAADNALDDALNDLL